MKRLLALTLPMLPLTACETSDGSTATSLPSTPPPVAGRPSIGSEYDLTAFQGARGTTSNGRYSSVTMLPAEDC